MASGTARSDDPPRAARLAAALRELDRLVDWEKRDRDASMRRGTQPMADLCARLGQPERAFRCVHVAGTKGKGTTSALVAAGLRAAGRRTGLYTSPHVVTVHERVQIDGELVGDEALAGALELVLAARAAAVQAGTDGAEATWFDCLTAAAFVVFRAAGVEWAVVECGLGGRLDSTNVVHGEVCVVTNIDLEHTRVLGTTRAAIAREKGGILKPGSSLVTGVLADALPGSDDDAAGVLAEQARAVGARVLRPEREAPTLHERNAQLARLVFDELGRRGVHAAGSTRALDGQLLTPELVQRTRLPARLERRRAGDTPVVLDAAHVPASVRQVLRELAADPTLPGKPFCILALGRDKDAPGILKELAGAVDRVVCTTVASGPLVDAETLVGAAAQCGLAAEKAADPAQALARALHNAGNRGWVLVIGSFHLAGAVRKELQRRETP